MKPLNSRYIQVLKNLCVIERCPLLGGNLKKIVTFATKCFICYSWHVRYLGCLLLGGFTVMTKIWEQEKYCTILITGLWLVRKVFYYEYVKQEKCIYFMPDTPFLLLFTFFSNARFFNFLFFEYIHSAERCISPPFFKKKKTPFLTTIMGKF